MSTPESATNFDFAGPARIIFGAGRAAELPQLAQSFGSRVLLVAGRNSERRARLAGSLESAKLNVRIFEIIGEPSLELADAGAQVAREFSADVIVGFGGGSAIDAAKAIAGLATNRGSALDYVEVIGRGASLQKAALPWIAVPTTAGTGAEVTKNAVLFAKEQQVKVSLRSPLLFAHVALVDPELSVQLPPALTASTGMDALTQLIEAFVSKKSNTFTDALCADALPRVARALPIVFAEPQNLTARSDMAYGSLCSGLALANAGLGAVHGLAAPIGGMFDAPHGAICAALLAPIWERNLAALATSAAGDRVVSRYETISRWLTGSPSATASDGANWVADRVSSFRIPKLQAYGIGAEHIDEIVDRAMRASSTKGNPVVLSRDSFAAAVRAALA
ncbi:MAG TPA: iron-containing alcohol dehydrogenase [Opitutaceae bacterium]|nr:iron-containing alcohol dehydrogenase [Opitutaceae bacterium]